MSAVDVVERLYAAYNAHDAEAAAALYAEDGSHHEVAQGRRAAGPEAIGEGLAHFLACFPDARWEPVRRIADGDAVAVPYRLTGTLGAPLGPFRELGARLELEGVHVVEVADGRIRASADYWDASTFARQMRGDG